MTVLFSQLTDRMAARLITFGSAAVLAGAYAFEFIGHLPPCELCLRQRIPHAVAIALGLATLLLFAMERTGRARLLLAGLTVAMAVSTGFGLHHVGVEEGWWTWDGACLTTATGTPEDPFGSIFSVPLVRCDQPAWTLLGVSMAGYNALISAALMAAGVFGLTNRKGGTA